jgi:hypothetical protein
MFFDILLRSSTPTRSDRMVNLTVLRVYDAREHARILTYTVVTTCASRIKILPSNVEFI